MKILITGAKGFIGKTLSVELRNRQYEDLLEFDQDSDPSILNEFARSCDFVFHFAGANRSEDPEVFKRENFDFTRSLLERLKKHQNACPVLFSSSIQANLENPYGLSKKACEDLLFAYGKETGAKVLIYRLQNVFGKWCRPNYNSAVATFCHNISRGLPVYVQDRDSIVNLVYIDDVVDELIRALNGEENRKGDFCESPVVYTKKLGEIVDILYGFKACRETISVPKQSDDFERKLYSTYLSCLPDDDLSYPLKMNGDDRGVFTEIIRTADRGQFSVNVTKPGIIRGKHWHRSKNEKFLVVSGRGKIELRQIGSPKVIAYYISGAKMEVVEIPPGYSHNITNIGEDDLVTFIWANQPYDPNKPDTCIQKPDGDQIPCQNLN